MVKVSSRIAAVTFIVAVFCVPLFAHANRAGNIALAHRFLGVPDPAPSSGGGSDGPENCHEDAEWNACPCCGGRMIIIETFEPGCQPRLWPIPSIGLDSS